MFSKSIEEAQVERFCQEAGGLFRAFSRFYTSFRQSQDLSNKVAFFCHDPDGEIYTAHDDSAELVASAVFSSHKLVKYWDNSGIRPLESAGAIPTLVMNRPAFEKAVVGLLTTVKIGVELYCPKGSGTYVREKSATPGNPYAFSSLLGENALVDPPTVAVIHTDDDWNVVLAYSDGVDFMGLMTFHDSFKFPTLCSALCQVSAKEAVICDDANLKACLERQGLLYTVSQWLFAPAGGSDKRLVDDDDAQPPLQAETLKLVISSPTQLLFQQALVHASTLPRGGFYSLCAMKGLLDYFGIDPAAFYPLGDSPDRGAPASSEHDGKLDFRVHDSSSLLLVTMADLVAMQAVEAKHKAGHPTSLQSFLDRNYTLCGRKTLISWIHRPLIDFQRLNSRLDAVEFLCQTWGGLPQRLASALRGTPNFTALAAKLRNYQKAYGTRTCLPDIVRLYRFCVTNLPELCSSLSIELATAQGGVGDQSDSDTPKGGELALMQTALQAARNGLRGFQDMVEAVIDLEELARNPDEVYLRREYNDDLGAIRNELDGCNRAIEACRVEVADKVKGARLLSTPAQGFFFRCTRAQEKAVQALPDAEIVESKPTGVKFFTTALAKASKRRSMLYKEYTQLQLQLEGDILEIASQYSSIFMELGDSVGCLDALLSFASVSVSEKWCRPQLWQKRFSLRGMTHPFLHLQQEIDYVPNDMEFPDSKVVLLTGPNAGGKTSFIRSLALSTLLAHMGCFVPAESASFPRLDRIAIRLGTADNLAKGMSTFMFEMANTSDILATTSSRSLVLIDELGRGTSTADGFGISRAVIDHLLASGCYCVFATHIHELTRWSCPDSGEGGDPCKTPVNMHLSSSLEGGKLRLLYKLLPGTADDSHGFEVAEASGFPVETMLLARELYSRRSRFVGSSTGPEGTCKGFRKMEEDVTDEYVRIRSLISQIQRADKVVGAPDGDTAEAGASRAKAMEELRECVKQGLEALKKQKL